MSFELSLVFGLLWLAWGVQALLSMLMIRKLLVRRFIQGSPPWYKTFKPFAHIIVPMKGVDDDLPANIAALCSQDYPAYRIVFVVESEDDPAFEVIQKELAHVTDIDTQLIVAGVTDGTQGQKVHNQLKALELVDAQSEDDHVWVFADSDAVPGSQWLSYLVGPLEKRDYIGGSTGYRWLVPGAAEPESFATHLASVMNSSIATFCGRYQFNRAWGGSMAVRVSTARRGDFRGKLTGALTDDYQLTRMVRALGLHMHFVPECVVPSPGSFTWVSLTNFVRRQYLITKVYQLTDYLVALSLHGLYCLAGLSAVAVAILCAVKTWWPVLIMACTAMGFVFVVNQIGFTFRKRIMRRILDEPTLARMRTTMRLDRFGTWFYMSLHFTLIASVALIRTMTWRGVRYRIHGRQKVKVIPN